MFLEREIAAPLKADLYYGCPPQRRARRADYLFTAETLTRPPRGDDVTIARCADASMRELAYMNPAGATGVGIVNGDPWL